MSALALATSYTDVFDDSFKADSLDGLSYSGNAIVLARSAYRHLYSPLEAPDSPQSSEAISALQRFHNTVSQKGVALDNSFVAEQEWEGYVTSISGEDFSAHLLDLTNTGVEEEATFSIEEVSNIHRDLIKEGAIFRWSIGYERGKGGTKKRASSIVFRRLPAWTKRDIAKSLQEAEQYQKNITWE